MKDTLTNSDSSTRSLIVRRIQIGSMVLLYALQDSKASIGISLL